MLEQKAPVFPQQYAPQAQMAQGSYTPMQDPSFHPMGQRPSYATLRMQPRPGLRPTGLVQSQPNQLRLQLQHRLQAQQVRSWPRLENRGAVRGRGGGGYTGKVDVSPGVLLEALKLLLSFPRGWKHCHVTLQLPYSFLLHLLPFFLSPPLTPLQPRAALWFPSCIIYWGANLELCEPQCLHLYNGVAIQSRAVCVCLWGPAVSGPQGAPRTTVAPAIHPILWPESSLLVEWWQRVLPSGITYLAQESVFSLKQAWTDFSHVVNNRVVGS